MACSLVSSNLKRQAFVCAADSFRGTSEVGVYFFMLHGVRVWLIDTPGFDDTNRSDAEVLKDVAFWFSAAYSRGTRLAGIIYLHRITDIKMFGSAKRNLRMFKKLCGDENLNSVVLATTHWKDKEGKPVPEDVGLARVQELKETPDFWGEMVERGSRIERHDGSKESATRIVSNLVDRKIRVILEIQKDMVDKKLNLNDTNAGQALQEELIEERKRSEARLAELKEDMEDAMRQKDVKWQQEIAEARAKFEADIRKGAAETQDLKTNLKKIAEEKEARIKEMEAKMAEERENFLNELNASKASLDAFKLEQTARDKEHELERAEAEKRAALQAHEHRERLADEARRIRAETNRERQEELERERYAMQEKFERDQKILYERAEQDRRRQRDEEQAEYRRREADYERQRLATQKRMEELELKTRKSERFRTVVSVLTVGIKLGVSILSGFGFVP
jgi:hypothetical protein